MRTAEAILTVIRDVTGLAVSGVVRAMPAKSSEGEDYEWYRVFCADGEIACWFYGEEVEIGLVEEESLKKLWSTRVKNQPPLSDQLEFIRIVLDLKAQPIFRVFTEEFAADIIRRRYDSEIGALRVSTRRLGPGHTEIVFEIFETGQILRLVQDRKSGEINLQDMQALSAVPF